MELGCCAELVAFPLDEKHRAFDGGKKLLDVPVSKGRM
jgi:hypothetical protein